MSMQVSEMISIADELEALALAFYTGGIAAYCQQMMRAEMRAGGGGGFTRADCKKLR